jgi:hypothetical protein
MQAPLHLPKAAEMLGQLEGTASPGYAAPVHEPPDAANAAREEAAALERTYKQQSHEQLARGLAKQPAHNPHAAAAPSGEGFTQWLRGERAAGDTFGYCLSLVRTGPMGKQNLGLFLDCHACMHACAGASIWRAGIQSIRHVWVGFCSAQAGACECRCTAGEVLHL